MTKLKLKVAVLLVLVLASPVLFILPHSGSASKSPLEVKSFKSYKELVDYLNSTKVRFKAPVAGIYFYIQAMGLEAGPPDRNVAYSTTNVQVPGVDEADLVKTDGSYLYVASQGHVYIVKAYPPEEAAVIAEVEVNSSIYGLFLLEDRLIVVTETWPIYIFEGGMGGAIPIFPYYVNTTIWIYSISNPEQPVLLRSIEVTGRCDALRLKDHYIYAVISYPAYTDPVLLPLVDGVPVEATEVKYFEEDDSYVYTIILAVDVETCEYTREVFLIGRNSYVYVSLDNLYLLCVKRILRPLETRVLEEYLAPITYSREKTVIYRFSLNGLEVSVAARGEVSGVVLDQFSMDEHGGYFRVATTEHRWSALNADERVNNVYVLDMDLNVVGSLEGLAPTESVYAARYLGDLLFLVTFRVVDPLFAIDLSDPSRPRVLGFLELPGYSEYLHPLGEGWLMGVGMDADVNGRVDGVKVALFNVSDPSSIEEACSIKFNATWSPIFGDHKAFTFNPYLSYVAIPTRGVDDGVYVVQVEEGSLLLRGFINHEEALRTLYIDEYIYTVSSTMVKIVDLNLQPVGQVMLS
ncbi:MAG: hypothetical protein DRJ98_03115 [Thermoprotei archaeon]|nr:MAG: hypothetical protein DRJ98_03115 [Thermoprotei archaeon]